MSQVLPPAWHRQPSLISAFPWQIFGHIALLWHSSDVEPVAEVSLVLWQEANAAMGLNGQMLGDRALKVENAKSARETTPQGATNPYTAIQLQQMQQLQLAQMQSSTLAAQVCMHAFVWMFAMQCLLSMRLLITQNGRMVPVICFRLCSATVHTCSAHMFFLLIIHPGALSQVAQLRALAKTNPNAHIPAMSANSASQKAAALAAAALLQKKFGQTSGPGNADHAIRKRRSPSPDR